MRKIVIGAGKFDPAIHLTEVARWKGGTEDTYLPAKVLEWSIKKYHPDTDIEIINTYSMARPMLRGVRNPTPFSLVRFWIPELCEFQGKAVYMDADMLVFADVAELFDSAVGNHRVWVAGRESVLVLDCEKLTDWDVWKMKERIEAGKLNYAKNMTSIANEQNVGSLPLEWNHLDNYLPGKTKLLHYTFLPNQPWRPDSKHPFRDLWWEALKSAVADGYITQEEVIEHGKELDRKKVKSVISV